MGTTLETIYGILLFLVMPLVFVGIGVYVTWRVRRAQAKNKLGKDKK